MKLEAAAGLRHLCTKDIPSLHISFPYAKTDTGRTRLLLLTLSFSLYVPALAEWFCAVKEGKKRKGRGPFGSRLVRKHLMFMAEAERGKSPAWWVGWATHTDTHMQ